MPCTSFNYLSGGSSNGNDNGNTSLYSYKISVKLDLIATSLYSFNIDIEPSGNLLSLLYKSYIYAKGEPQSIQVYNTGMSLSEYIILLEWVTLLKIHWESLSTARNYYTLIDFARTNILNKNKLFYYYNRSLELFKSSTNNLLLANI